MREGKDKQSTPFDQAWRSDRWQTSTQGWRVWWWWGFREREGHPQMLGKFKVLGEPMVRAETERNGKVMIF